ncbi:hypothetical protein ACQP2U_42865 (plasmid) [Nocardia sp. CA-084685]|uniref:hypothetical protein n=1 Tax=Nocardia sp. CA-084685 TaxID=3239970 RepID=UPI003D98FD69
MNPGNLRRLLVRALRDLHNTPDTAPPVIRLACGMGAFVVAGHVSDQLRNHAVPPRDNFVTVGLACARTVADLGLIVGPYLAHKHGPDTQWIDDSANDPRLFLIGADADNVAPGMVTLGVKAHTVLAGIAHDEAALPEHRRAATSSMQTAALIWSHYGGDGGGW